MPLRARLELLAQPVNAAPAPADGAQQQCADLAQGAQPQGGVDDGAVRLCDAYAVDDPEPRWPRGGLDPHVLRAHAPPLRRHQHLDPAIVRDVDQSQQPASDQPRDHQIVTGVRLGGRHQLRIRRRPRLEAVGRGRQPQSCAVSRTPVPQIRVEAGLHECGAGEEAVAGERHGSG